MCVCVCVCVWGADTGAHRGMKFQGKAKMQSARGEVLYRMQRPGEALEAFGDALLHSPHNSDLHVAKAGCLFALMRFPVWPPRPLHHHMCPLAHMGCARVSCAGGAGRVQPGAGAGLAQRRRLSRPRPALSDRQEPPRMCRTTQTRTPTHASANVQMNAAL